MLSHDFETLYLKFRANFYKRIVARMGTRKGSLSATELFCVEVILLLGNPTISEFASYLNISLPNANYKINSLIEKDYVQKINSADDKREYRLASTSKYENYRDFNKDFNRYLMKRVYEVFTLEEQQQMSDALQRLIKIMDEQPSEEMSPND